jgi:hypothetical protein
MNLINFTQRNGVMRHKETSKVPSKNRVRRMRKCVEELDIVSHLFPSQQLSRITVRYLVSPLRQVVNRPKFGIEKPFFS